ncbi:peptidase inhibitor R3HDML isoform X2 [Larus michahellis]|uniref:peptidase inhibitor R3HDML isoform X2 n=1 Tax=Larus michahellis TaxID=119627 RepID=UPI003D9B8786
MAVLHLHLYLTALGFWMTQQSSSFLLPNATELLSPPGGRATDLLWGVGVPRSRRKRYLSPRDMSVILDYHNQVRAQVSPPAANMEYMVPLCCGHGEIMAPGEAALLLSPPPRVQPPLPLQMQRLCLQPLHADGVGILQPPGLRPQHLCQRAGVGQHVAARRPPRLQLRHQGQLAGRSAIQSGAALLSLPPHLRRGLLQQHVLHWTQIQPSQLVLGLQPCKEAPASGDGVNQNYL